VANCKQNLSTQTNLLVAANGQKRAKPFPIISRTFLERVSRGNRREDRLKKGSENLSAARVARTREANYFAGPIRAYLVAKFNPNPSLSHSEAPKTTVITLVTNAITLSITPAQCRNPFWLDTIITFPQAPLQPSTTDV
jgi:hypothetical protein